MSTLELLRSAGIAYYFAGTSALDHYYRMPPSTQAFLDVEGNLVDLARASETIRYPGMLGVDAEVDDDGKTYYVRCLDGRPGARDAAVPVFNLRFDPVGKRFIDPADAYSLLRSRKLSLREACPWLNGGRQIVSLLSQHDRARRVQALCEVALLAGRYGFEIEDIDAAPAIESAEELSLDDQRILLTQILEGADPGAGLQILMDNGFIHHYWPLLEPMMTTDHSKEFHPEGNVWEHSLETFRYRKTRDITITLALLLHDSGKPDAIPEGEKRFHQHAELGAENAVRFLSRMNFSASTIAEVEWLIRYHMIPGALPRLPIFRTRRLMRSPLFPALLEVYRCDLSSTFRGPDGYYRACRVYRDFLRNESNPFRDSEGKKLVHLFVE